MEDEYLDLLLNILVDIQQRITITEEDEQLDRIVSEMEGLSVGQDYVPYYLISPVGQFLITTKGLNVSDIPTTDIAVERKLAQTYKMDASFSYHLDEMDSALETQMPLPAVKADNNYVTWYTSQADVSWQGRKNLGIYGIINHPDIGQGSLPPGENGATSWNTKTPKEIYQDLVIAAYDSKRLDKRERADTIILPPDYYNIVMTTHLNEYSSQTIAQAFLQSHPQIEYFEEQSRLESSYIDPVTNDEKDIMIAFDSRVDRMERALPRPYQLLDPQRDGPFFKVYSLAKTCGVIIKRPPSVRRFILN